MSQKPPRPRPNVMRDMEVHGLVPEIARVRAEEHRELNNLFSLEDQKEPAPIWLEGPLCID